MSTALSLPASAFVGFGPFMNDTLAGARGDGCENVVVHRIQQQALDQFIFRCNEDGIDPTVLSARETREMMDSIWQGMLDPKRPGRSLVSVDGFDALYDQTRASMEQDGVGMAEHVYEEALVAMRVLCERTSAVDRKAQVALEKGFVSAGREAASASRVAGGSSAEVLERFRADPKIAATGVGATWLDSLDKAIGRDDELALGGIPETRPRSLLRALMGRPT